MLQAQDHGHPGQDLPGFEGGEQEFVRPRLQGPGGGRIGELLVHDDGQIPGGIIGTTRKRLHRRALDDQELRRAWVRRPTGLLLADFVGTPARMLANAGGSRFQGRRWA
jgi:hypothetical protein